MQHPRPQTALGRRVLQMSLAWLFLGAVNGVVNGLPTGSLVGMISMMIGGMLTLPVLGLFLGLISADCKGSVAGAAGGLLGCGLANLAGAGAIQQSNVSVIMILCALLGATCFQFARFLVWKYLMILKLIGKLIGLNPVGRKALALAPHFAISRRLASYSFHYDRSSTSPRS